MKNPLLLSLSRWILPIPRLMWQRQVASTARQTTADLAFMTPAHHQVRNFVVTEITRTGKPLAPATIAEALSLPLDQVVPILDELEKHMTFLFRNEQGAVVWAYPVTADTTPHRVTLSTGERVYAA